MKYAHLFIFTLLFLGMTYVTARPSLAQSINDQICPNGPVLCAADVRQCPDGSYVSRTGCNCEFAACPGETNPTPTCEPRPSCLDDNNSRFRCYPPEPAGGWCPSTTDTNTNNTDSNDQNQDFPREGNQYTIGLPYAVTDLNQDRQTNLVDYELLIAAFRNSDIKGDINQDGQLNLLDFAHFKLAL